MFVPWNFFNSLISFAYYDADMDSFVPIKQILDIALPNTGELGYAQFRCINSHKLYSRLISGLQSEKVKGGTGFYSKRNSIARSMSPDVIE